MEPVSAAPSSDEPEEESTQLQFAWAKLQAIVLDSHEVTNGVVLDLPAERYDVIGPAEKELDVRGGPLNITVERKQELILLTATAEDEEGHSLIRTITAPEKDGDV